MAQGGDDARGHQEAVRRAQGAQRVAEDENPHQGHEGRAMRKLLHRDRHDRRADEDAQRIAADQPAGGGDGDGKIGGNLGQQPHDDEFGVPMAKALKASAMIGTGKLFIGLGSSG